MSQSAAAVLPDPQAAYDNLFQGVHQQIFFKKCAAHGLAPRTAEDAQWMLDTAGKLRQAEHSQSAKQAADEHSPFYRMNAALDQVLARHGLDGGIKQAQVAEEEMAIKEAAELLATDPLFYNSVLALKAAEASQLQHEFHTWQQQNQAA